MLAYLTAIAGSAGEPELLETIADRAGEMLRYLEERCGATFSAYPPIGLGEIHAFEIFGAVAVIFFVISFPLTRLAAYLEKRLVV